MATTYALSCSEDCTGCSKDAKMPIGPKMPRLLDPATIPKIGSSPNEVLHYRPCTGISSIYTNPATHLERQLQYDTIVIKIARALSSGHPQQAAYGVYMGKEKEADGDEDQITGYSPPMCPQTRERAEVMAVNSAVRRALTAIENCVELPPGNQISKVVIMNSSGWLSHAFNETVYGYLQHGFPAVEAVPGVSDEDYRYCHFHIQKIEKKAISLQFWDISERDNDNAIKLATKAANDTGRVGRMQREVAEEMEMRSLMALLRERRIGGSS